MNESVIWIDSSPAAYSLLAQLEEAEAILETQERDNAEEAA